MGRIIASITVENLTGSRRSLRLDALVHTGASHLTLPAAWRDRLGVMELTRPVNLEPATQSTVRGEVCGPVKIEVEGFPAVSGEVLFLEMAPEDGEYEPLLGYIPLEACQAAVDMIGHRLVPVKQM